MIGKTLGHYQVLEKLGEGGMGVVYKARDTHLDRSVALKVLPPDKLADAGRNRRFIQEAKSASALNHPNIVHIYDIAEADGVLYIAMEYVKGKSLGDLIGRKGLRPGEALKYAVQAADALAKAHAAGIVHRDLKPANIMVNEDGVVKLLDFGLAKLTDRGESLPAETGNTETLTAVETLHTEAGVIVGTAAYMSPEQAEGRRIDSRSDIFSFGAVLYELVTGHRAFQAGSLMATLSAVLREEPKPVGELVGSVPRELERVIARCLRKDPERRWQTMADLKVALQELREESDSGSLSGAAAVQLPPRPRAARWLLWALASALVLVLAAVWFLVPSRTTTEVKTALQAVPLTSYPGRETFPSFSPDGNQVAFRWDGEDGRPHIYIKLIGPGRPLRLTNDAAPDWGPAWSPDGRSIAFYRFVGPERAALMLVPALGGTERRLAEFNIHPGGSGTPPSWFPNGKSLVLAARMQGVERNALYRCSVDTGELVRLTEPPAEAVYGDDSPAFAPDGRTLAFVRSGVFTFTHLYLLPISEEGQPTAPPKRLDTGTYSVSTVAWTADTHSLLFAQVGVRSNLVRIPLDGSGGPVSLNLPDSTQPAVSIRGNRLVYAERRSDTNIWVADLDGPDRLGGPPRKLISSSRRENGPHYSPDSKRIAFSANRSGNYEIWVADADGQNVTQLTFDGARVVGAPRWSPDGRSIAFDSNLSGAYNIYVVNADGGKPRPLTHEATNIVPGWAPDGSRIYFGSNRTGRLEIWSMNPAGADLKQLTSNGGLAPQVSADGRTIFYAQGEGTSTTLLRISSTGGEEQKVVTGVFRYNFVVTPQGVYFCPAANRFSLSFLAFDTGKTTELLASPEPVDLGLALSPDGRHILFAKIDQFDSDLMLVENFR